MPNYPRYPRPQVLNGLSGSSASRRYADGLITVHEASLGLGACLPIKAATFSAARPWLRPRVNQSVDTGSAGAAQITARCLFFLQPAAARLAA
jgi:hypothetical protein